MLKVDLILQGKSSRNLVLFTSINIQDVPANSWDSPHPLPELVLLVGLTAAHPTIGTPSPVIEACKALKDIQRQNPLALTIAEGRSMTQAVTKRGVVFQTGSQEWSDPNFRCACELVRDRRISWRIEHAVGWESAARDVLYRPTSDWVPPAALLEELRRTLPETRRWIMSQPLESSNLWHLLTVGLVPIADLDPAFARLALDPETWRAIVHGDREIDEETRGRRLKIVDGYFRQILNNALLHLMGALACNHFEFVVDLLDQPNLSGSFTSMIPYYLFVVLIEKVKLLRDIV